LCAVTKSAAKAVCAIFNWVPNCEQLLRGVFLQLVGRAQFSKTSVKAVCAIFNWVPNCEQLLRGVSLQLVGRAQFSKTSVIGTSDFDAQMSLNSLNGVSKNPSFYTEFKNVHLTFVKSAPKKSVTQKTDFSGTFLIFQLATVF
jgi:hypothetical protein